MKKFLVVVLCLAMVFTLSSCGKKEDGGMPNPVIEKTSLEEINEAVGVRIAKPATMGVTDEVYQIIDCDEFEIAEYRFSLGGFNYCFRGSYVVDQDISGVYRGEKTAFADDEGYEMSIKNYEDCKIARWFTIDGQYVLYLDDENDKMPKETFEGIANELASNTLPGMSDEEKQAFYESLAGGYSDTVSQRAGLVAEVKGDKLNIVVSWASSAFETTTWEMDATLGEDGLLYYQNEKVTVFTIDEDENEAVEETVNEGEGYFAVEDGKLSWTGALTDYCQECVFEK